MPATHPDGLDGDGENDYERYVRTGALLALQRRPEEVSHRDELLFQAVHQCTELLLKVACSELTEAARGNGSGNQSPGWRAVRRASAELRRAFAEHVADDQLAALYAEGEDTSLHRLAEAMIDWDERVSLWRVRHFKLAARMNGHSGIGTRGMPVEDLRRLVGQQLFPALWSARDVMAAPPDPA